jgi:3-oxoacyl-[acyl-carrier protein] reductase
MSGESFRTLEYNTPLLANKICIITGSTRGIGLEIARLFLHYGAKVVINSRNHSSIETTVSELAKGFDVKNVVLGSAADVGMYSDCERLVDETVGHFGGVDVLVNNAGISMVSPSIELKKEDWDRTIGTDLSGAFYMSQIVARHMIKKKGSGSIINISSILGEGGLPKRAAYCAAKHGLIGLTKALATEWARSGIRVNAISPGYIKTEMDTKDSAVGDYSESDIEGRTPIGRYGTSAEVAEVALFLASPASAYITGANLTVDGGWTSYAGWDRLLAQLSNEQ